jgi:hypothetical protein
MASVILTGKLAGYLAEWTTDGGMTWTAHPELFPSHIDALRFADRRIDLGTYRHDSRVVKIEMAEDGALYRREMEIDGNVNSNSVVCPHCRKTITDLDEWELGDEESESAECGFCEKPIVIACSISVTYSAAALVPFEMKKGEGNG